MALLRYNKNEYVVKSLKAKLIFEARLTKRLAALFREYSSTVFQSYVLFGLPYFPNTFEKALKIELLDHYIKVGNFFMVFNRRFKKKDKKAASNDKITSKVKRKLEQFYERLSSDRANKITQTAHIEFNGYVNSIRGKLDADGVQLSRTEVAKLLKETIDKRAINRGSLIATTETTVSAEKAKELEFEAMLEEADDEDIAEMLGEDADPETIAEIIAMGGMAAIAAGLITPTKTWNAVIDANTRPEHAEADGQTVSIAEAFIVGGEELQYPGDESGDPGNTINCRCTVSYDI